MVVCPALGRTRAEISDRAMLSVLPATLTVTAHILDGPRNTIHTGPAEHGRLVGINGAPCQVTIPSVIRNLRLAARRRIRGGLINSLLV
jgi:hypothetical protein